MTRTSICNWYICLMNYCTIFLFFVVVYNWMVLVKIVPSCNDRFGDTPYLARFICTNSINSRQHFNDCKCPVILTREGVSNTQ